MLHGKTVITSTNLHHLKNITLCFGVGSIFRTCDNRSFLQNLHGEYLATINAGNFTSQEDLEAISIRKTGTTLPYPPFPNTLRRLKSWGRTFGWPGFTVSSQISSRFTSWFILKKETWPLTLQCLQSENTNKVYTLTCQPVFISTLQTFPLIDLIHCWNEK